MVTSIVKRDGRIVPFDPQKITFAILRAAVAVGGRNREVAEAVTHDVLTLLEERFSGRDDHPTVEEVQDAVEKALIERGHARTAKAYIVYRYEHALKRAGRDSLTYSSDNIPYRKLWQALSWAVDHDCHSLAGIRRYVESGRFGELVHHSEAFYATEVGNAIGQIKDRIDELRVIIIAGPSSSGKTTTTAKIAEALPDRRLVPINVDNYFFDLATHPTDPRGDYDFETPQALDLDLLNGHLRRLLAGEPVDIPFYNFKTGNREGVAETIALGERDVLLIDSLHGLYEPMTESVPASAKFKLYIETLAQVKDDNQRFIRWTDVRMLRRMVRDMQFRNYNPEQTLHHWYLVRRAELRYIVSRLTKAEVIVNSFLPCELPLMKDRLGAMIPDFIRNLTGDPEKSDALDRANRIAQLFAAVVGDVDHDLVPRESVLREFIGGGIYSH